MNSIRKLAAAAALGLAACTGQLSGGEGLSDIPLDEVFARVAADEGVPVEILESIGYVETGWQMVAGHDHDGAATAFGVMGLRGDRLERAAALAGLEIAAVESDEEDNIRAAAALLRELADAQAIDRADLGAWAPVVGAYSGIDDPEARQSYVVDGVYEAMRRGVSLAAEDGQIVVEMAPVRDLPELAPPAASPKLAGDRSYSLWRPSPNHEARGGGPKIDTIVIHSCEGSYPGCWGWLRNPSSQASAHYVISGGGEISQLVAETRRAWHTSAEYSCAHNSGAGCDKNGVPSNQFSIGIEHAGFSSQGSWPEAQLDASARLVCDISRDYGIPRDATHIVSHGQLQPWNRVDPGDSWPWADYLARVRAHCGDSPSGSPIADGSLVIDSNDVRNDPEKARFVASGEWLPSDAVAGYVGTGYRYAAAESVADGAEFRFFLESPRQVTVEGWWTAHDNRSSRAPFVAFDADGREVGRTAVDQRRNGSRWNELGTWTFAAGWNKIILSRWLDEDSVVVADALRIR